MAQDRRCQEAKRHNLSSKTRNSQWTSPLVSSLTIFLKNACFGFAGKYKDNEAIEFSFDLNKDVPEDVAQEMVRIILTSNAGCKKTVLSKKR